MYVLITYDVESKRTVKFKKLLRKYLDHIQFSVFSGDLSEAKLIELRRAISQILKPGEQVTEVTAANRKNIEVVHLVKNKSGKGEAKRVQDNSHSSDYGVL